MKNVASVCLLESGKGTFKSRQSGCRIRRVGQEVTLGKPMCWAFYEVFYID